MPSLHDHDLCVLGVGLGGGGVGHDILGQGHAVPDAVDALGVQLHHLVSQLISTNSGSTPSFAHTAVASSVSKPVSCRRRRCSSWLVHGVADDHFALALDVVQIAARCGRSRTGCTAGSSCRCRGGCTAAAGCKAQCQSTGRNALAIRLSFISFSSHRGRSASRFPLDLPFYHAKVVNYGYRVARLSPFCKRKPLFFAQCTALPRL